MVIQKRPEETGPRGFQMGQILRSSGGSKTNESRSKMLFLMLFFILLSSGTWVQLVGAISPEPPLNLDANVKPSSFPPSSSTSTTQKGEGDEKDRGDVFVSSGLTDYSTSPSASKFSTNGQFARSSLTAEKSGFPSTTHEPLGKSTQTQKEVTSPSPVVLLEKPESFPKPALIPEKVQVQSDSPLSPIVSMEKGNNGGLKGNPPSETSSGSLLDNFPQPSPTAGKEKPANINLLRKLWSSTRSSKLNLTHEHQSLLRIESEKSNGKKDDKEWEGSRSLFSESESRESSTPSPGSISHSATTPSSSPTVSELTSLQPPSVKLGEASSHDEAVLEDEDAPEVPLSRNSIREKDDDPSSPFSSDKRKAFGRNKASMLYPEWLSSGGGVYPDDSTNGTGEYYGDPEYENLISNNENNPGGGEREEEGPPGRLKGTFRKRVSMDFLERFANLSNTWTNRMKQREREQEEVDAGNGLSAPSTSEAPEAIIAENGLADVISRGRIDSVMYVYFGDRYNDYHKEEVAGRVIQAVGGVVAAVAQVLTVLGAAKCVRKPSNSNKQPPVHHHIGLALLLSNLLLLLAVHATEPSDVCAIVAMILHYLHLVIGCWLLAHTIRTYVKLRRNTEAPDLISSESENSRSPEGSRSRPFMSTSFRYSSASWTAPLPFIIMSYVSNPDGYETRHYCWMSIEKGMVISFIVPVFLLIGANTFLVVLSLRHLLAQRKLWADSGSGDEDEDSLDEKKISSGIRASAMLLPLLAVMWFLGVVALENASSIFFQIASASANIALSWLVLYFLGDETWPELCCCLYQKDGGQRGLQFPGGDDGCHGEGTSVQPGAHLSFEDEPLLSAASTSALELPSTSSAYGSDVGHFVCKPAKIGGNKGKNNPSTSTSTSGAIRGKRGNKSCKRPNWSTPGGNEIYELKMDSISTICT